MFLSVRSKKHWCPEMLHAKWVLGSYIFFAFTFSSFSRGVASPNQCQNSSASRPRSRMWRSSQWLFRQMEPNISEPITSTSKLRISVTDAQVLKGICKVRYQKFLAVFKEKLFNFQQYVISLRRKMKLEVYLNKICRAKSKNSSMRA